MHPSNLVMTLIGAGLLWVGWFGFNAGSAVESSLKTAQALTATQTAAAAGAVTWMIIEALHQGKATGLGFASGVLAGLVAVTPAAGVVQPGGALVLGIAAACICYGVILLKNKLGYDDSLDAFGVHGVGGTVGALLLVLFIRANEAPESVAGQFGVQFLAVAIAMVYAAVFAFVIAVVVEKTVGLKANGEAELAGLDHSFHGEHGYGMLTPAS
jgi:Amt family ammonium transporter